MGKFGQLNHSTIDKRYNDFRVLNQSLIERNFKDLPPLPAKTLLPLRNQNNI